MFEDQNRNSNLRSGEDKLIKIIYKSVEISGVAVNLILSADLIRNPCLPFYIGGHWVDPAQCLGPSGTEFEATWSMYEIWTKLLVALVNFYTWSFIIIGGYFHGSTTLLIKSYCLKRYILLVGQKIEETLSGKDKPNWRTCVMYREIEVMSTEYRRLYSCHMTVVFLLAVMCAQTITLYACLKFGLELPVPMLLFFVLCSVNSATVLIYMYTNLATVYSASTEVLETLRRAHKRNDAWFRRYLKSCKIVKVYIGRLNFVEPLTPLNLEQFSVEQALSLMLLED